MVNHAHPEKYVEKILNIMPDGIEIQAKDLRKKASEKIKNEAGKPIGGNTLYRYIHFMIENEYITKSPKKYNNQKTVYYLKKDKLIKVTEDMINKKTDFLLAELRKELDKTIAVELEYCIKYAPFKDNSEKMGFINEILNEEELKLTLGRILVKHGKELVKNAFRKK